MTTLKSVMDLILWVVDIALLIRVAFDWLGSTSSNPVSRLVHRITDPILQPLRRYIRPLAGLDITPVVAIVILGLIRRLVLLLLF
jgi:YggT family protein